MPAFEFILDNKLHLVTSFDDRSKTKVPIFLRDGSIQMVTWCGFRGWQKDVPVPNSRNKFAKMPAISVTGENGGICSYWRKLLPGEFVLSWLSVDQNEIVVVTLLDKKGIPRVTESGFG